MHYNSIRKKRVPKLEEHVVKKIEMFCKKWSAISKKIIKIPLSEIQLNTLEKEFFGEIKTLLNLIDFFKMSPDFQKKSFIKQLDFISFEMHKLVDVKTEFLISTLTSQSLWEEKNPSILNKLLSFLQEKVDLSINLGLESLLKPK